MDLIQEMTLRPPQEVLMTPMLTMIARAVDEEAAKRATIPISTANSLFFKTFIDSFYCLPKRRFAESLSFPFSFQKIFVIKRQLQTTNHLSLSFLLQTLSSKDKFTKG